MGGGFNPIPYFVTSMAILLMLALVPPILNTTFNTGDSSPEYPTNDLTAPHTFDFLTGIVAAGLNLANLMIWNFSLSAYWNIPLYAIRLIAIISGYYIFFPTK
jgi:hypothetical protein